ncbi:MAG: thiolase family protein [Oligoflexia bacterium]|nr:thiolase family protein [Oligoflexia bacterium]
MKSENDVVIVEGVRTPFVKAGLDFKNVHAAELGKQALKELIAKTNLNVKTVDEVIIGNTGTPSDAVNISRVVALNAGIPKEVSAYTVHRNCASAMESVAQGFDKIKSGMAEVVLAGGTENMSQMPLMMSKNQVAAFEALAGARSGGQKLSALAGLVGANLNQVKDLVTTAPFSETPNKPIISLMQGLTDPFCGINMGQTAEILAKEFEISRAQQDEFALSSHQKALRAGESGIHAQEMTPVFLPPKFEKYVSADVGPRKDISLEKLSKLKPFFDKKFGTITVGNSCPITDGAAMILMMKRARAEALGYKPLGVMRSYAFMGLEPERMGLGPTLATPVALKRAGGMKLKDIGLIELNEAFAAQVIACKKAFNSKKFYEDRMGLSEAVGEINDDILNVNGGAIALGHPVGATGSRLIITLLKEMQRRGNVQFGLATLCIGGGQGGAVIVEREN